MNELNKLYKDMLMSWGAVISDKQEISFKVAGEEMPISIDGMRLHLPTSEVLDGNTMDKVFFHPACENILSKETEIFKLIRKMTGMTLLVKFREIPVVLFDLAGKEKKSWKQNILDMMTPLKTIKKATRTEVSKLFSTMTVVNLEENGVDNRFIHFRTTKGGGRTSSGERVYYKTVPQFPFYAEIVRKLARTEGNPDNHPVEFNGNSYSRGCLKIAAHLFQQILPAVNSPDDFSFDSTTAVAARLLSYLGCYGEIASQLNRIQNLFRMEFDKAGYYVINLDWMEYLEELPEIYRQVPSMDYNSNNTSTEAEEVMNNVGNMLNVTTNQSNTNQNQSNQSNNTQQMETTGNIIKTPQGEFDISQPRMLPGEIYENYHIDFSVPAGRVVHRVRSPNGNTVFYNHTRMGNLINREEISQAQQMYNQQVMHQMHPQQQMMNNGMGGMNGMYQQQQQMNNGMYQMGFNNPQPATQSIGTAATNLMSTF